jgi:hypothetical protein
VAAPVLCTSVFVPSGRIPKNDAMEDKGHACIQTGASSNTYHAKPIVKPSGERKRERKRERERER